MDFAERAMENLGRRLSLREIKRLSSDCSGIDNHAAKEELFSFVKHDNERIAYNALWVFTHLHAEDLRWLTPKRNELIDCVLSTNHAGKQRLLMTLLEHQSFEKDDIRPDYLDFCLSHINSTKPCSIRMLCLKQAFAQCRFYPELIKELLYEIDLMEYGDTSPGLTSARKNILKRISRLEIYRQGK